MSEILEQLDKVNNVSLAEVSHNDAVRKLKYRKGLDFLKKSYLRLKLNEIFFLMIFIFFK